MSLKHALLIALHHTEGTGYEIAKQFDRGIGYFWTASHQQIYQELAKLKELGWVSFREVPQAGKPNKKIYTITNNGCEELRNWARLPAQPLPIKDALLMKLYVGYLLEPSAMLAEMQRQRKYHQELLAQFNEIRLEQFKVTDEASFAQLPRQWQFAFLTLRNGIVYAEGWLTWADEVMMFLQNETTKTQALQQ